MSTSHKPPSPLNWLTVLRYPAALWVLLLHCLDEAKNGSLPATATKLFMERGYLGVSFFFMLSGFILAYNYPVIASKRDYLAARAARVLPVYYLSLFFTLPWVVVAAVQEGFDPKLFLKGMMVLTLTQSWVPTISGFWNGPAWTLSCEAFFYISLLVILGPLTTWCSRSGLRPFALLAACFFLGLVAPAVFHEKYRVVSSSGIMTAADPGVTNLKYFVERFPLLRWLEFVAGVALCLGVRSRLKDLAQIAPFLCVGGIAWVLSSLFVPFIFSMGTWCLPGFALLIVGAAALPFPSHPGRSVGGGLASLGILLGNASYAVYLFHYSIIGLLLLLNRALGNHLRFTGEASIWALFFVAALLSTLVSVVIHHFYEEPARRWVKRRLGAVPHGPDMGPKSPPASTAQDGAQHAVRLTAVQPYSG